MRYHRGNDTTESDGERRMDGTKRVEAPETETPETGAREVAWEVDGLQLAGLEWGPQDGRRVLALHGWMDHAESFRELAPRLAGCRVVAVDLSGQGLSARRAAHATYNIWDDLPQLIGVLDRLGWEDCALVGHSRGGIIGALLTAAFPERVRAFVALDTIAPRPHPGDVAATLRAFVLETRERTSRPPRTFASREDYLRRRGEQGNSRATSEALADRALEETAEGLRMRGDPRLFASSAVKLTRTQVEGVLRAIRCPVLNIWAENGTLDRRGDAAETAKAAAGLIADYRRLDLPGDHHFHLDPAAAAPMAAAILDFLAEVDPEGGGGA